MKLPKTLYVKIEEPESEDSFLNASDDPTDLSEGERTVTVGKYELVRMVNLVNATVIK